MKSVLTLFVVFVIPVLTLARSHVSSDEDHETWKHFHTKRHLPMTRDSEMKKRTQPPRYKKKPAGSLISPLREDDIDNDEIGSVAIGPPLIAPRYEKTRNKYPEPSSSNTVQFVAADTQHTVYMPKVASTLVVDVLTQLGKELLSRHVSEDFIFGQYVGNAMRNLTIDNKLELQHQILELIVHYQKMSHSPNTKPLQHPQETDKQSNKIIKIKPFNHTNTEKQLQFKNQDKIGNDTEEWSVLGNLENNEPN